jgi:hypothetical protein
MDEKRLLNEYREVSMFLSIYRIILKQTIIELEKFNYSCMERNTLLLDKLTLESRISKLKHTIRKIADSLPDTILEKVLA